MPTPTPEQFQTVIDTLKSVLPRAQHEGHLDMAEPRVNCQEDRSRYPYPEKITPYECGTVHCVAGWYAIGAGLHKEGYRDYCDGAMLMAKQLGFDFPFELRKWASDNPAIWGNAYGNTLFDHEDAWGDAETLADCVAHLEGVRNRLAAQGGVVKWI